MAHIQSKYTREASMPPTNEAKSIKKLRGIQRSVDRHWVGNGFPVRTLFAYPNLGSVLSPFLLLDYAGSMEFAPTDELESRERFVAGKMYCQTHAWPACGSLRVKAYGR